tara:strand:- start:67 stop:675 length:609 start_codon:yes stop_codon:yes gene_type:complete
MVEPNTLTAINAAFNVAKFIKRGLNSIEREPGKALRAGLRAFEDLRENPDDLASLQLARHHFDAAEYEEEGYFKALALMGSALCLNAEGSAKPAARRIDSLLALKVDKNKKVLVKEGAKQFLKTSFTFGVLPTVTKALVTKRDMKTAVREYGEGLQAEDERAARRANAEIYALMKLQELVRESGANPTELAQYLEKADLSAL